MQMQVISLRYFFLFISGLGGTLYIFQIGYFSNLQTCWCQVKNIQASGFKIVVTNQSINSVNTSKQLKPKIGNSEINDEPNLKLYTGRFDNSRQYRIYEWVWTSKKWDTLMQKFDVCLSTQTSIENIFWMLESSQKWQGPISAAIYLISLKEFNILKKMVTFARTCSPDFANYVSIHVAFPATVISSFRKYNVNYTMGTEKLRGFDCNQTKTYFEYLIRINTVSKLERKQKTIYPQNHMRNIARKGCGTDWVFSSDIDIIPRPNSAKLFQEFHNSKKAKKCKKCAYVIPTFELEATVPYPSTKNKLIEHWKKNQSRPFHFRVFKDAHIATDHDKWKLSKDGLKEGPIKVSHKPIKEYMKYYEPFYISPDTIPAFDERFIGYGFTRSSQVQEARAEGWTFKVLTPIFAIHWGMQSMKTLISPGNKLTIRTQQIKHNSFIFYKLLKEGIVTEARSYLKPNVMLLKQRITASSTIYLIKKLPTSINSKSKT